MDRHLSDWVVSLLFTRYSIILVLISTLFFSLLSLIQSCPGPRLYKVSGFGFVRFFSLLFFPFFFFNFFFSLHFFPHRIEQFLNCVLFAFITSVYGLFSSPSSAYLTCFESAAYFF